MVVAEYMYRVKRPGREALLSNVQITRAPEGLIVPSRDFHDHARLRALMTEQAYVARSRFEASDALSPALRCPRSVLQPCATKRSSSSQEPW